jgi:hypothetical protein
MASLSATAMAAVPRSQAGMAGGALSTFRQLGYALGIAVLGEVFRGQVSHVAGPALAGPLSGGEASAVMGRSADLSVLAHRAFADGLDVTFAVAAGIGLAAGLLVLVLVRARVAQETTHAAPTSPDGAGSPQEPVSYQ